MPPVEEMTQSLRVCIVGCGLGGLACAIGCLREGLSVIVLEQANELAEVCHRQDHQNTQLTMSGGRWYSDATQCNSGDVTIRHTRATKE